MKRDLIEIAFPFILVTIVGSMLFFIGYTIWWNHTHHCTASHREFVPEHDETETSIISTDPYMTASNNVHIEAHYEYICDAFEQNKWVW